MVNSRHRVVEVPLRRSWFFRCIQTSRYFPREHRFTSISSFPFLTLLSPMGSVRGFVGRLETRAVYTLFFSRRCKGWQKLCARKHEQECRGDNNVPSKWRGILQSTFRAIFSSLYSLYPIVRLAGLSIYSLVHGSVPSMARTKVTLTLHRGNANSRSIGKAGLWAVFVCARHVDV